MDWKEFFYFTKVKLIIFLLISIILTAMPVNHGICRDGIDFGYCIYYHGIPFKTFISGDVGSIPTDHYYRIITARIPEFIAGFLGNVLIAYLLSCLLYFTYKKIRSSVS